MAWQARIDAVDAVSAKFLRVAVTVYDDAAPSVTRSGSCEVRVAATAQEARTTVLAYARALRDDLVALTNAQTVAANRQTLVGQVIAI